jgi:hypothetical protein
VQRRKWERNDDGMTNKRDRKSLKENEGNEVKIK